MFRCPASSRGLPRRADGAVITVQGGKLKRFEDFGDTAQLANALRASDPRLGAPPRGCAARIEQRSLPP